MTELCKQYKLRHAATCGEHRSPGGSPSRQHRPLWRSWEDSGSGLQPIVKSSCAGRGASYSPGSPLVCTTNCEVGTWAPLRSRGHWCATIRGDLLEPRSLYWRSRAEAGSLPPEAGPPPALPVPSATSPLVETRHLELQGRLRFWGPSLSAPVMSSVAPGMCHDLRDLWHFCRRS